MSKNRFPSFLSDESDFSGENDGGVPEGYSLMEDEFTELGDENLGDIERDTGFSLQQVLEY